MCEEEIKMSSFAEQIQTACPTLKRLHYRVEQDGIERFEASVDAGGVFALVRVEFYSWPDTEENRKLATSAKVVAPAETATQPSASGGTPTAKELAKQCKHELELAGFKCASGFVTNEYETQTTMHLVSVPVLYCTVIDSVQEKPEEGIPRLRLRPNTQTAE